MYYPVYFIDIRYSVVPITIEGGNVFVYSFPLTSPPPQPSHVNISLLIAFLSYPVKMSLKMD